MATGKQIQKKGSSHFTPTPATGMFKPRPFAEPAKPEAATPEVQTKVELGNIGGDRLGGMQVSSPVPIQAKLTIGAPGDKYEQEADTIARKVVRQISAPTPPDSNPNDDNGSVQRQFSAPSISRLVVQRREAIEGGEASSSVESTINQARSSGVPLVAPIRRQMEGAFGADFSGVRIHANNTADTLNRELSARAFTTGNNIFFKRGEYNPSSSSGKELLAHELTHVVQQQGGNPLQRKIIQRKMLNLSELPSDVVNEKQTIWGGVTTPESRKIHDLIVSYNRIHYEDKNYKKQKEILNEIIYKSQTWVQSNQNNKDKQYKIEAISSAGDEAEEELNNVIQEEKTGENTNDYADDYDVLEDLKSTGSFSYDVLTAGIPQDAKQGWVRSTMFGEGQSLAEESKNFLNAIQTAGQNEVSLLDAEKNSGTQAIVDNYRKVSNLPVEANTLSLWNILSRIGKSFISLGKVAYYVYSAYSTWKEWRSFVNAQKDLKEDSTGNVTKDLTDAIEHGMGKIKRRFWSGIGKVMKGIINTVAFVLTATGVGAAVGAITKLATSILDTIATIFRKIKGLWKFFTGTRGANRKKSATTLVYSALDCNPISLQILVDIDPIGFLGRAIMGGQRGVNSREQKIGKEDSSTWGKVKEVGKAGSEFVQSGLTGAYGLAKEGAPKTKDEMYNFLVTIKEQPAYVGMNLNEFIGKVADKLKSQS